ncbi:MAG TPA: FAD-dependent oxidoreductase [Clostridiales bacterium]|nr:FAD-dependent oxidoreductase [Clostridiales bacterium]
MPDRPSDRRARVTAADTYDVVIVGAGPAGIFAALSLKDSGLAVCLLEKGPALEHRTCPMQSREAGCARCTPCALLCGWGGAGAYSDGKLTLTPAIGGKLQDYVGQKALGRLIEEVDRTYLHFGAPETVFAPDERVFRDLQRRAATADLILVRSRVRHLGTERCREVLRRMREELEGRVTVMTRTEAVEILVEPREGAPAKRRVAGVRLADGTAVRARYLICGPGREGAGWLVGEIRRLGLGLTNNPVDIGVRVELPAVVMEDFTDHLYEPKLIYYSKTFDDQVRTFCMNPYGQVVAENSDGLLTVNGHSYATRKTELTNFALLVSKTFTEPFREPIAYGRSIAGLANMLGDGVIVQRLGDLQAGRRSTPKRLAKSVVQPTLEQAVPGDLSLVLPYRHLRSILEMLEAMDRVMPGVNSRHTLLYGVEVKFYSSRPELTPNLETKIANFFAVGDGAGVTRGLVQASASGLLVAREILKREGLAREQTASGGPSSPGRFMPSR